MPTISRFFGTVLRMYFDEHPPPPFHVYYGEFSATILIDTFEIGQGSLPRRALALVLEWASEHRNELRENWRLAEAHEPLEAIEPLK